MANEPKTIMINDVEYAPVKNQKVAEKRDGMEYVIIRADRAGVFAGYLESKDGQSVIIRDCRRLWYWDGAASISQIAVDGVSKPENCKFPEAVDKAQIDGVIEVLYATEKARKSISCVGVWKN